MMGTQKAVFPFGQPWITAEDRQVVLEVLQSPLLTQGPQVRAFEEEFARFLGGECFCVAVSSCMAALHLAYLQLGLGPGDEVLLPAQTHVATAHAVELVGAKPVFVDCDPHTGNINPDLLPALITPRTRALSVVHFLGIPCDMEEILTLAQSFGLWVVEDCALAPGARLRGKPVGLWGDVGCFSFYPVKHLTTGEGGMLVTRHAEVAEAVARLRAFGLERSTARPGLYDVVALGLNYRMSEMQAALGRGQLRRLGENLERRQANFARLRENLADLEGIRILDVKDEKEASSHYCLSVVLEGGLRERRSQILAQLQREGVGTSIYYPHPVPRLTYYRSKYGFSPQTYPQALAISDGSIALPVGPHLTPSDMDSIAQSFRRALRGRS